MNKFRVCLITPGHIATNPRLVKEINSLTEMGFHVHIIFTQYLTELTSEDQRIIDKYPELTFNALNWTGDHLFSYFRKKYSGLLQKISIKLVHIFPAEVLKKIAVNRHYFWQVKKAQNSKSNLYIAHNLGALPIAVVAAKNLNVKCGFDAEDFHRFELSDDKKNDDVNLRISVEEKYMPSTDYLTAASPLIAQVYKDILGKKITTILNVFPRTNIITHTENQNQIKLFWFSQTVGPNRGLEIIVKAMGKLQIVGLELHLLGKCNESYKSSLKNIAQTLNLNKESIVFHDTISPDNLIQFASTFDIGLATEIGKPYNREICLTNKIFTYLQAGLAIVASNTLAQKELISQYGNFGELYNKNDENSLVKCLKKFIVEEHKLSVSKKKSIELANNTFNWNNESIKFKQLISQIMNGNKI